MLLNDDSIECCWLQVVSFIIVLQTCKLPEDNNSAETRRSKLIVKYTIYRIVHLLVLVRFAVQVTKHGMNIMKGTMCIVRKQSTKGG